MKGIESRLPPSISQPASGDELLREFDERLTVIADEANKHAPLPAPVVPREQHEFVTMTNQALDAMIATFEKAVNEAQSQLNGAKALADKVRADIDKHSRELDERSDAAKAFAGKTLANCTHYLGGET